MVVELGEVARDVVARDVENFVEVDFVVGALDVAAGLFVAVPAVA